MQDSSGGDTVESRRITLQMFELYLNDIYDLLAGENFYGPNPSGQGLACYEPLPGREDRHMAESSRRRGKRRAGGGGGSAFF